MKDKKTTGQPRAKAIRPLPCPFCGEKPKTTYISEGEAKPEIPNAYYSVGCVSKECPAIPLAIGDTKEAAISQWNTRTPLTIMTKIEADAIDRVLKADKWGLGYNAQDGDIRDAVLRRLLKGGAK